MYLFLQKLIKLLRPSPANTNLVQRVPPFILNLFLRNLQNQKRLKGPPFNFFRHCATFFRKFFNVSKESPFYIFRHYETFSERKKSKISSFPPFTFFGTMRHFLKEKNQKFQVFPPFYIFWHYATFSERKKIKNFKFPPPLLHFLALCDIF